MQYNKMHCFVNGIEKNPKNFILKDISKAVFLYLYWNNQVEPVLLLFGQSFLFIYLFYFLSICVAEQTAT